MLSYKLDSYKNWLFLAFHLILFSNLLPIEIYKLLFLIPYGLGIYLFKISWKYISIALSLTIPLLILQSIIPFINQTYFSLLNDVLGIRNLLINWVERTYDLETSSLINLLIFSHKSQTIYKEFLELGIAHLVTVSGLHFSILNGFFRKIFRFRIFVYTFLFLYWLVVGFTIPGLRSILFLLIPTKNSYKKWSLSVLISLLFNIHIYKTFSFLLSYFVPLFFILNKSLIRQKVNRYLANYWFTFIYVELLLLPLDKKINTFHFINSFIFYLLITIAFVYFFFTWFLSFLSPVHWFLSSNIGYLIENLSLNKSNIELAFWDYSYSSIALFFITLLFLLWLRFTSQKIKVY